MVTLDSQSSAYFLTCMEGISILANSTNETKDCSSVYHQNISPHSNKKLSNNFTEKGCRFPSRYGIYVYARGKVMKYP